MLEIVIDRTEENKKRIMLIENGVIVEKYEEDVKDKKNEGNIYLRKSSKYIARNASCICGYWTK